MADRRNNNRGGSPDIFGEMYNDQLEKYQRIAGDTGGSGPDDLRFYSEDELAAAQRARQDAARQAYEDAYNDAYREEYDRIRNQQPGAPRRQGYQQRQPYQARQSQPQRGLRGGEYSEPQQERPQHSPSEPGQGQGHRPGSYEDRRRKVRSSAERYAEATERKRGGKQLAFGRNDPEGEKIKKKKGFTFGSFMRILLILIIVIVLLLQVLILRYISMVNKVQSGNRLVTAAELSDTAVTNILLIGCDSRREDESGRTDSMIILSINRRSKEITLTSVMRDSYVDIPGQGWGKLNSAYTYGGAELLLDTIQQNFGIKLDRYVFVSFFSFINIVDAMGGLELDISDEEAQGMTDPMAEQNKYLNNKKGTDYLKKGGKNLHVNGNQALAYARLRYVGNADFERTDRQRLVINKIVEKAKKLNPIELDNFLKISCQELTTDMSGSEMYLLFYKLMFSLSYDRGELRIPQEGAYTYGSHDGLSTLDLDFDLCKKAMKETIYK